MFDRNLSNTEVGARDIIDPLPRGRLSPLHLHTRLRGNGSLYELCQPPHLNNLLEQHREEEKGKVMKVTGQLLAPPRWTGPLGAA